MSTVELTDDDVLGARADVNLGVLYVVATPIGNLADMTTRAVQVLQQVDLIATEDTRHSGQLLQHFGISTPMKAYHDHSSSRAEEAILERLLAGKNLALISDAGTPLIADPGYQLVNKAKQAGIEVVPIPGACALIAALSASGLATDRFVFEGFLPAKDEARRNYLQNFTDEERSCLFYEAPHRVLSTLQSMVAVFGPDRELVMARELTKHYETIRRDTLAAMVEFVASDRNQQRGEIVLVLAGKQRSGEAANQEALEARRVLSILLQAVSPKQAVSMAVALTGLKKNFLYQIAIDLERAD